MPDPILTVGTAGHIDHGKTTLVAALTGVDTDRLPQEKSRGMTIELGFAPLDLPSGRRVSVVDVPGHERFVRTMVSGVGGIDVFLLVVAADDGPMPQTLEHLAILDLLGIETGVIAVTKTDTVEHGQLQRAMSSVDALVCDSSPWMTIATVAVSARTSDGMPELTAALDRAVDRATLRYRSGSFRMPVDRVFTLRGIGTIVTGTVWSGTVAVGDTVAVEPGDLRARARSVHVHDQPRERASAGHRAAVALPGISRDHIGRGSWLVTPGSVTDTYRVECDLRVTGASSHDLDHGGLVTVHHGTAHVPARVVTADGESIRRGESGRAQLRLRSALFAVAGDRIIVRLTAPPATVAGGVILNPTARRTHQEPEAAAPVARPSVDRTESEDELHRRIAERPLAPPNLTSEDDPLIAGLVARGLVVRASRDIAFDAGAFWDAADAVLELAADAPGVTLAEVRDRLGCSRRHAQAIVEALDSAGFTRRVGERRMLRRKGRHQLDSR